jgi:hypothetical protein
LGVRAVSYVTLTRHGGDEGRVFEQDVMAIAEVLDCYAVAGNGLGLRAAKAYDAQATGSADEGCSDDTFSDGHVGVDYVSSCTASATANSGSLRGCVSG